MSPPGCCLSSPTRAARSVGAITVELLHSGAVNVEETTYFFISLNLSANSPWREGHAAAKPSKVLRPSSNTSASMSSSSLNLSPSGPRSNWNAQPPRSRSSAPPGSSNTPSVVTNCETTSFAMSFAPQDDCKTLAHADAERGDAPAPAAASELVGGAGEHAHAGRAERMAQRDRSAVGLDPLGIETFPLADVGQALRRERLVELDHVDVLPGDAGPLERAVGRLDRGDAEHVGVNRVDTAGDDPCQRLAPDRLRAGLVGEQHCARAVVERRGIAGRHRAALDERGLELGEL